MARHESKGAWLAREGGGLAIEARHPPPPVVPLTPGRHLNSYERVFPWWHPPPLAVPILLRHPPFFCVLLLLLHPHPLSSSSAVVTLKLRPSFLL